MKVTGQSVLHAPPDRVWQAINDPAVLAGVIPGCDAFTALGEGHYAMTVSLGVAAVKGSYTGEVRLSDTVPPRSLTMRATGSGAPGTIDTTVAVTLADLGDGTTRLDYDADAVVGGMVGGVGQRVLTSVARKTAGLFFSAIDDVLTGKRPAAAAPAAGGTVAAATSAGRPSPASPGPVARAGTGTAVHPLAAAAFGALSMAVGVLIGARVSRRR